MKPVNAETRTRVLVLAEEGYTFLAVGTRLGVLHKTVSQCTSTARQAQCIVPSLKHIGALL